MLDLRFNGETVTEKEFKALAKKHLDYFDYVSLCGRGYIEVNSKFYGEKVTFSLPHPCGLSLFGFFYEEMDGSKCEIRINNSNVRIYAVDKKHALSLFLLKYGDENGKWGGANVIALNPLYIPDYAFEGYSSADERDADYFPERPVEI